MTLSDSVPETLPFDPTVWKGEPHVANRLAAGDSVTEAARAGGVDPRTVRRRWSRPEYKMFVSARRQQLLDHTVGRLVSATTDAARTVHGLLEAKSETVRLGAAKAILELGLSLQEALETQQRITSLEELYVARRHMTFEVAG